MLLWQLFCILLGSSFFTGDVWSRSGSHCRPLYLVISSLWGFIGLWALVGCSCGQWLENSCSKCWKSHRNYCSWRAGTPPSLHEWCIFGMYFLKWTNWLNSMNVSSHSCELSVSVTTPLSLHILPNAAECSGFCEDWHWALLFLSCTFSLWLGRHTNLSMAPQPFLAYSGFPEPAAFS